MMDRDPNGDRPLTVGFRSDVDGLALSRPYAQRISRMWALGAPLFNDRDIATPDLEVVIARHVDAAIAAAKQQHRPHQAGTRPGNRRQGGAPGAEIVGDISVNPARDHAIVIVAEHYAAVDAAGLEMTVRLTSRLLGHIIYQILSSAANTGQSYNLAEDAAGLQALQAAAHYRSAKLGVALSDLSRPEPADSEHHGGQLADQFRRQLAPTLTRSLNVLDRLWEFRNGRIDITAAWEALISSTSELTRGLAVTAAYSPDALFTGHQHPVLAMLEPFWRPLLHHLETSELLPDPTRWPEDNSTLLQLGQRGLEQYWKRLGVTTEPIGGAVHVTVNEPDLYGD